MFLIKFFVILSLYFPKPLTKDLIFYIIFPKAASTKNGFSNFHDNAKFATKNYSAR